MGVLAQVLEVLQGRDHQRLMARALLAADRLPAPLLAGLALGVLQRLEMRARAKDPQAQVALPALKVLVARLGERKRRDLSPADSPAPRPT